MRTPGDVVSTNIRALRERRGLTVRELSVRMAALGRPLLPSGITKIEYAATQKRDSTKGAPERRRVDVEDLAALALALDTSPAYLMAPRDDDPVQVTPERETSGWWMAEWCRGEAPLPPDDEEALLDSAPEYLRRRRQAGLHPAILALTSLETMARDAVLADRDLDARGLADALRYDLERVTGYVTLLANEADEVARRGAQPR